MNWSQYGKTFQRGFKTSFTNDAKNKYFSNFAKNINNNKYYNNFINANLNFKKFSISIFNIMNFQTVNYLNNCLFNSMKISSEGFNMLTTQKSQEDISALLARVQTLNSVSSVNNLNDLILGLKGINYIKNYDILYYQ